MEAINWLGNHIEIIIKSLISIVLLFPFFKTWKACEDEIKYHTDNLNLQYKTLQENGKKTNEFYDKMCSIDFSGMENEAIFESRMNLYKASVKEYKEHFLDTLERQNEEIKQRQDKVFELRKNEWKSIVPFLSVLALMWLDIKF